MPVGRVRELPLSPTASFTFITVIASFMLTVRFSRVQGISTFLPLPRSQRQNRTQNLTWAPLGKKIKKISNLPIHKTPPNPTLSSSKIQNPKPTMVDVDRRSTPALTPSHAAGLRRLSTRASAPLSTSRTAGLHSFSSLASSLTSSLRSSGVNLSPGLTEPELTRIESTLGLTFPPDLRALLSLSLPSSPGFPNWRSPSLPSLRPSLDLPIAAISLQIARNSFWPKSWGPRPSDPAAALRHARSSLKRAPLLIPVFHRCYIPSLPSLAGNPVFFLDDHQISLCGLDLADFFARFLRSPPLHRSNSLPHAGAADSLPRNPRWIEFWSDAAACDRKRRSSSSTSDPERFVEIRMVKLPEWLREYLDSIGSVLKSGGWGESEVNEMVEVTASAASSSEFGDVAVDAQAVLDALLLKADRCSDSLRRAGWSSEEVFDVLGFDFRLEKGRKRPEVKLPAEIRVKIGKLAEAVARS